MINQVIGSGSYTRSVRLMRGLLTSSILLCCAAVCLATAVFGQGRFADIGKRVSPAVVKLESFDSKGQPKGLGTGFVVGSNGLIATNYHVIRSAYHVRVTCANRDTYDVAGVVSFDELKDFAILRVAAFDLPVIELGNSNQVVDLEEVIAIGHPLGLHTSSTGVISGRPQENGFSMLQTTAPISPGNSGGPLINLKGQVIGIITAQMSEGQNLNFALPINYVRAALETNTQVRFTLEQVAEAQAKQDEQEFAERMAQMVAIYQDKYKAYKALVPKNWQFEKAEGWANKDTYEILSMVAPQSAARAAVQGYLSEGIRVTITMPPKGKVWTYATSEQYAPLFSKQALQSNPGFVQTLESSARIGEERIKVLEFVGQNPNIQEPEKVRFYVLAKKECRVIVECVAPASKFKDEELVFRLFMESFEFKGCPTW
jgi:hypothetical protein